MNAQPVINREESGDGLAQLRSEIAALKDAVALMAQHVETGTRASRSENFVHKDEFRLFKWIGGLALASILGGFGFLYQGLADLGVAVERQHGELRSDMDRQFADVRERLVRVETLVRSESLVETTKVPLVR